MNHHPASYWGNPLIVKILGWWVVLRQPSEIYLRLRHLGSWKIPFRIFKKKNTKRICHFHHQPGLVGGWATPLKNMSSSIGMISNPILMGKNKIHGNQTTNQKRSAIFTTKLVWFPIHLNPSESTRASLPRPWRRWPSWSAQSLRSGGAFHAAMGGPWERAADGFGRGKTEAK